MLNRNLERKLNRNQRERAAFQSPWRRLIGSIAVAAIGVLAGCADTKTPESPEMTKQHIPPDYQVTAVVRHYPLTLLSADGSVSTMQQQGLASFLTGLSGGNAQALHIRVAGRLTPEAQSTMLALLVAQGVEPAKIEFRAATNPSLLIPSSPMPPAISRLPLSAPYAPAGTRRSTSATAPAYGYAPSIDIVAEVYKPLPPLCPRTSRTSIIGPDNGLDTNFGCSTVSVFEQMVADPRDLVRGESGGTTDSEVTSGAIDRMRKDKTKALTDTGSVTTGAGGS